MAWTIVWYDDHSWWYIKAAKFCNLNWTKLINKLITFYFRPTCKLCLCHLFGYSVWWFWRPVPFQQIMLHYVVSYANSDDIRIYFQVRIKMTWQNDLTGGSVDRVIEWTNWTLKGQRLIDCYVYRCQVRFGPADLNPVLYFCKFSYQIAINQKETML